MPPGQHRPAVVAMPVERATVKTTPPRSAVLIATLLAAVLVPPPSAAAGDQSVPAEIARINGAAATAWKARDFAAVEKLRLERLAAAEKSPPESSWARGAAAIREAEALFDKLRYGEACGILRAAWKPDADSASGPVFGDVAMKLFEVAQGALAIHPDCLDAGNPEHIATEEELRSAIQTVVDRDPCAGEAHAVLQFLESPDPREAFARLEMRPSLARRNKNLLALSYDGRGPAVSWQAAVEWLTAETQAFQFEDIEYGDALLDRGSIDQITGWDSRFEPFALLPNSWLLIRLPNAAGYDVPSLLYFVAGKGGKSEWRSLGMHVLLVQPAPAATAPGPVAAARADIQSRLSRGEPLQQRQVGNYTVKLFDVPSEKADRAVECLPYMFMERWKTLEDDVEAAAARIQRNPKAERPSLLLPMREVSFCSGELPRPAPSRTAKGVSMWELDLQAVAAAGPVLVVTRDGRPGVTPPFLAQDDGTRYLVLRDGGRLRVNAEQARMEIDFPGAQARLPLSAAAVPGFFLPATVEGKQILERLIAEGHTPEEAAKELQKSFADPRYRPGRPGGGRTRDRQPPAPGGGMDEPLDALRRQFYGFRYLVDARGRSITSQQALKSTPIGVQPQEHPFVMFDAEGAPVKESDTGYTIGDWQKTYANIVDDFMPKSLWLAPSPALWRVYERLINRMPRVGGTPIASTPVGGAKLANPWNQPPAPPAATPPTPPAAGTPAVASGTTAPFIPNAAEIAREIGGDFWSLNTGAFPLRPVTDTVIVRDAKGNLLQMPRPRYVLGGPQGEPARSQLMAIYFRQAGADAIAGKLHRSLVCYQDVMEQSETSELDPVFFQTVPNAESLRAFESQLEEYVRYLERTIVVRMEMAAVLRAAGLAPSAEFLERGIVERLQLSTLPVIDQAIEYANSYGFKEPPQVGTVRRRIEAHLDRVVKGPPHDGLRHVRDAFASPAFGAEAGKQRLAIEAQIAALTPGEHPEASDVISREVRLLENMPRSMTDWLAEKKLFLEKRPQHLVRPFVFPPPEVVCPCVSYDATTGCDRSLASLLAGIDAAALADWAKLDAAAAAVHGDAGRFHFLLGWYWLERKNPLHARNAFLSAARAFAATAGGAATAESLIATRNSIVQSIAAAGIADPPPGVMTANHDRSLNEFVIRMIDWKRKWVALSLPADQSEAEFDAVKAMIDTVRVVERSGGRARVKPRYFFFDYRFENGPIPDVVVAAAVATKTVPAGAQPGPSVPWSQFFVGSYSFPTTPDEKVLALNRPK